VTRSGLCSLSDAKHMIADGRTLLLAGDESLLSRLPPGNWIGGTAVNFIASDGG
jgi:hypothetical protein